MLEAYVELDRSREELSSDGFDPDVVERAVAMIDRAEYKRRQAPPGVRLRPKAFGRDRRTPITNRWRGISSSSCGYVQPPIGGAAMDMDSRSRLRSSACQRLLAFDDRGLALLAAIEVVG